MSSVLMLSAPGAGVHFDRGILAMRGFRSVLSLSTLLVLAACGGGGGGGGNDPPAPPATNAAPQVNAGTDTTATMPNAKVSLTGSATDDGPASSLQYQWSAEPPATGVTFSADKAAATEATFAAAGTYTLKLTVSDGTLSGSDTVVVTVGDAPAPAQVWPADDDDTDATFHGWAKVTPAQAGMTEQGLNDASLFAQNVPPAGTNGKPDPGNGMIVRHGQLVHFWGDIDEKLDVKSVTKSMGGIALGLAIDDAKVKLTDTAFQHYSDIGLPPAENAQHGRENITLAQLATHTAGFPKDGAFLEMDPNLLPVGSAWRYSDGGLNWLADTLTAVYGEDLATMLQTRVWTKLGLRVPDDIIWRAMATGDRKTPRASHPTLQFRELASGIQANANAMARVGLLFLRNGMWKSEQILSKDFVTQVQTPLPENATKRLVEDPPRLHFPGALTDYGVLWWTNKSGLMPEVPTDTYWAWGLGEALIVVIPSLDLVIVRNGGQSGGGATDINTRVWNDEDWDGDPAVLEPFLNPIVAATTP